MKKHIRGSLVACLFLVAVLPASAARKLRAVFIQPGQAVPEKALLYDGMKGIEVELPQRNFSPEVNAPDGDLELVCLQSAPDAGQKLPAGAPRVRIPKEWDRCLLLFFPDPKNTVFPARIIAVNASDAEFKAGESLLFNVSPATVRGTFGDKVVKASPGEKVVIPPPIDRKGDYLVAIDSAMPGDKEPTPICRTTWRHEPEARQILFVTPEPGTAIPRVWGILDRPDK